MTIHESLPPLVIIGSSAGGVDALMTLLGSIPSPLPAAVVIAQHLDPAGESHLEAILGRRSIAPVRIAADGMPLERGVIYVVPPNYHAEITGGALHLFPGEGSRPIPSIDRLMGSAAREAGERVIAVMLSGTGSDGAIGAHAIKTAGGTVIIQDPATAAYPAMPLAVAANIVDLAAPVEEIGAMLGRLLEREEGAEHADDPEVQAILERVRQQRGVDFSDYRPATIGRRLRRRMAATRMATPRDYRAYLEAHPEEEAAFIDAMLIKVTEFFREAALFDQLRQVILPELLARAADAGAELRVWSAGCATGEEAYSLAMLLRDLQRDAAHPVPVRIFATDLDDRAITFARRGIYPAASLAALPPESIARHFVPVDNGFEIAKEARALVVFGQHDLVQRPPFPNIDLLLCRNVLIYFSPELQERVLQALAYSLNEGGYLVLGRTESTSRLPDFFEPVDRVNRIYRRAGARAPLPGILPSRPRPAAQVRPASAAPAPLSPLAATGMPLLAEFETDRLPFGLAVIDRRYDIRSIDLPARRLLGIHGIAIGEDFIHLAQRVPSSALRSAIDTVFRNGEPSALEPVMTTDTATGEERHVAITCYPGRLREGGAADLALVVVTDVSDSVQSHRAHEEQAASLLHLVEANRQLLTANQELTLALADAKVANEQAHVDAAAAQANVEEILTLNEELQAANEELETLNEETQATVEELKASNDELALREQDLRTLTATLASERDRLASILQCIGDAVVVIDRNGDVVLSNGVWDDLNAREGGKVVPLDAHGERLPQDQDPLRRAARGEEFLEEFTTGSGDKRRWYEAHGRPWTDGERSGGILAIRDITERSLRLLQDDFIAEVSHELRTPLTVMYSSLELARNILAGHPEAADALEFVDMAWAMAQQQGSLVDDLLDTARLAGGGIVLTVTEADLAALVRDSVDAARLVAGDHRIIYDGPSGPVPAEIDANRIRQVLMALLHNARDYSPPKSDILARLTVDRGMATVSISDSGVGISPEDIDRIFGRLSRADASRRIHHRGLGLGLYIAREIALAHGGEISVASTPGEGSVFTVKLPLKQAAPAAVKQKKKA